VPVELTWSAPPECPTGAGVLARVRELTGAAADGAPLVRAEGEIKKVGNAFELRLLTEQEGQRGERLVRSAQCDDLRGVAAVALTLLLTSGAQPDTGSSSGADGTGAPEPTPGPPQPPPAAAENPVPEPPHAPDVVASPASWRVLLTAPQLALQLGPLPRPSPALSLGLGLEGAWWSLRLLGQWGTEQSIAAPVAGYGAEAQRATAGLWACTELHAGRFSLAPCLLGSVARLRASGYGPFLVPLSRVEYTWAVGAGLVGRARVTNWLALMVAVGGQVELQRPELRLDGTAFDDTVGPIGRLAPASALVVVGPEWIF
jgi:hypothetical protein